MRYLFKLANLISLLAFSVNIFAFDCPQMPASVGISNDVKSEIDASVGKIAGLKAGELSVKTEVTAKNLYDKYPNIEQLTMAQAMSATYCSMLKSATIPDKEKLDRWERFQSNVLKFPPSTPPVPPIPPIKQSKSDYLLRIKFGESFANFPSDATLTSNVGGENSITYDQQIFGKEFKTTQALSGDLASSAKLSSVISGEKDLNSGQVNGEAAKKAWSECSSDKFNFFVTKISKELGMPKSTAPNEETNKSINKDLDLVTVDRSADWHAEDTSRMLLHMKYTSYIKTWPSGQQTNKKWACRLEICAMQTTSEAPCYKKQ